MSITFAGVFLSVLAKALERIVDGDHPKPTPSRPTITTIPVLERLNYEAGGWERFNGEGLLGLTPRPQPGLEDPLRASLTFSLTVARWQA